MADTFGVVKSILQDRLCVEHHMIVADARLIEDLECDSLDMIELTLELEDAFNITITDDQLDEIKTKEATVQKVVDLVEAIVSHG